MANSRKLNETRTNAQKTGYAITIRGLQVDTTISGSGIDGRLIAGSFESNTQGVTIGALYANGSLGTNNYVLRTNGTNTFWGPAPAGSGGPGGNTAGYLQVANAVATYQTIAIERAALANTNAYIATKLSTATFNTVLANTNAYIATKVNTSTFNSALANTNAQIQTKADWSALTSTNTSLRTLISDRLQVANAAAIYQTKAIERAALANTNAYIATKVNTTTFNTVLANTNIWIQTKADWSALISTNTALRTLISDRLQVANAAAVYQTKAIERAALANTNAYIATKVNTTTFNSVLANTNAYIATKIGASNPATSGLFAHTGRATISTNLTVSGNTSSNKIIATNRFESRGNNVLGAAGKTQIVNGILASNGNITVTKNATISGNTRVVGLVTSSNGYVSIPAANRKKYMFWTSGGAWALGFDAGYTFGPLNEFALTSQTDASSNRGWWWGTDAMTNAQGAMALDNTGSLYVARKLRIGYGTSDTTDHPSWNATFDLSGNMYVSGNSTANKITATNRFESRGNNVLGAAGKTQIVNGILASNGNITVTKNLTVTGNTSTNKITVTSALLGSTANAQVKALGVGTAAGTNGSIRATNDITAYYSDERLKTIIEVIPDPLDKVMSLRGFYFTPNEIARSLGYAYKREVGVSAQEVQSILPEIVVPAPIDEKYLTVKYEKLIPLLIEAIKELTIKVKALEAQANVAI